MDTSVDHRGDASSDRDFTRVTSATAGVWLGSIAVLATPTTALLFDLSTVPGVIAMICVGAVLTLAHLGLQFQAAVLVLRDGRWLPAVSAAAICAATLTALYLLASHHGAGWYLLVVSAVAVAAYASTIGPGPSTTVSRRADSTLW